MDAKRWFRSEELHLAPQLEGLPQEERLRRFQRARRDAFMRRPGLGTLLTFTPLILVVPVLALFPFIEQWFPQHGWWLKYLFAAASGWVGTRLTDRCRARLIARELERDGPFLL